MITDKDFYNVIVSIRESKGFDTTEKTRFRQRADRDTSLSVVPEILCMIRIWSVWLVDPFILLFSKEDATQIKIGIVESL